MSFVPPEAVACLADFPSELEMGIPADAEDELQNWQSALEALLHELD
jgi:hypothetical protein